MAPTLRIEFDLQFKDFLAFNLLHQLASLPMHLIYLLTSTFFFFLNPEDEPIALNALTGALFYIALWVLHLLYTFFYLCFGSNHSILTKHILEIQDKAIYHESKFDKSLYFWPGFTKVVSRPGFIAVYLNAHAAHVIPGRAFHSYEQRELFFSTLKQRLALA